MAKYSGGGPDGSTLRGWSVIILGYHKVGPASELGMDHNIEVPRLNAHVRFFARRGYRFAKICQAFDPAETRTVAFTFDDGFASTFEHGLPVLERYGKSATVYVVTGLVGTRANWTGEAAFPLADWAMIRDAAGKGHDIGNHTMTHARLGNLSAAEQQVEIAGASSDLRAHGIETSSVSLPWGSSSAETRGVLLACGVPACVSATRAIADKRHDRLDLPRFFVEYEDTLPALLFKVFVRPRMRPAVQR